MPSDTDFHKILRLSRHAHTFKRDGYIAIYHALLMEVVYIDTYSSDILTAFATPSSVASFLQSVPEHKKETMRRLVNTLENLRLLVETENKEDYFKGFSLKPIFDLRIMYIVPTDRCNLKCKYCYIENSFDSSHRYTSMKKGTLEKGVDLFFKESRPDGAESRKIIFYGGEPLLCEKLVVAGFEYIRNHAQSRNTEVHLITNGTLLTDSTIQSIRNCEINVAISMDGPPEVHDSVRSTSAGFGSYAMAKDAYTRLYQNGVTKLGISITIGAHNVDHLRDNVQWLIDDLPHVNGVGFNLVIDFPQSVNPLSVDPTLATKHILEAFEMLRARGIYEDRIMRKLVPFVKKQIHLKDCGAVGNQFVLAPDGSMGPCQAFLYSRKYFTKHVCDPVIDFENDLSFKEWATRMPLRMPECLSCYAIAVCGGGCPYEGFVRTGSIWGLDENMCAHNRAFLEWAIWDAFAQKRKMQTVGSN